MKDDDYKCVPVPLKTRKLKAQRYEVHLRLRRITGFTKDKKGRERPNGIAFDHVEILGIKKL